MKKVTTLATAIVLSTLSFGAYAHNHGQGDFFKNQRVAQYDGQHDFNKQHKKCHHKKISPQERHAKMQQRIDRKVERMADKFKLSQKQQHELKQILQAKYEKKRQLRKESRQQIHDLLTPEQRRLMKKPAQHV